jgi:hypothetical protein
MFFMDLYQPYGQLRQLGPLRGPRRYRVTSLEAALGYRRSSCYDIPTPHLYGWVPLNYRVLTI